MAGMKPRKAHDCMDCKHASVRTEDENNPNYPCTKGHKPRFYLTGTDGYSVGGWKRRCEDFREGQPKGMIQPGVVG